MADFQVKNVLQNNRSDTPIYLSSWTVIQPVAFKNVAYRNITKSSRDNRIGKTKLCVYRGRKTAGDLAQYFSRGIGITSRGIIIIVLTVTRRNGNRSLAMGAPSLPGVQFPACKTPTKRPLPFTAPPRYHTAILYQILPNGLSFPSRQTIQGVSSCRGVSSVLEMSHGRLY